MRKSIIMPAGAIAIAAASFMLLPLRGHDAAAQGSPYIVNAINLDIAPDKFDAFMEVAKENAAASAKDPGCLQFNIMVSQTDPHHIMFYEVYENAAAVDFHRQTEHFKKYQATTRGMVLKADVGRLFSVAMNLHGS
jgi:autoinducer 2-degrading protein